MSKTSKITTEWKKYHEYYSIATTETIIITLTIEAKKYFKKEMKNSSRKENRREKITIYQPVIKCDFFSPK